MFFKGSQSLFPKGYAINQKKYFLRVTGAHQRIHHSDAGTGFSCTGGHHQQKTAFLLLDTLQDSPDSPNLIVASSNGGVYQFLGQRFAVATDILEPFQIITGWESRYLARRIVLQIPEIGFQAVSVKAEW